MNDTHMFAQLVKKSTVRKYKPGSVVIYQGEAPRYAGIIIKGIVKVYNISSAGTEQVVMFNTPGEFFPKPWVLKKVKNVIFFYEAMTECEIAMVPRDELLGYMTSDHKQSLKLVNYLANGYTASLIRINSLQQSKARDKLLYTLYFLCQRYNKDEMADDNKVQKVEIPLPLAHKDFADFVGLTRETTAMELNKLRKEKIISYTSKRYIVNYPKLMDAVGEDSLKNITMGA